MEIKGGSITITIPLILSMPVYSVRLYSIITSCNQCQYFTTHGMHYCHYQIQPCSTVALIPSPNGHSQHRETGSTAGLDTITSISHRWPITHIYIFHLEAGQLGGSTPPSSVCSRERLPESLGSIRRANPSLLGVSPSVFPRSSSHVH